MASPAVRFSPINFKMHFLALDGMRGFALLVVFVTHFSLSLGSGRIGHLISRLREVGVISVDLWFVLSSFLITGILYDTRDDSHCLRRFFARRAIRIFPVFYLVAAIIFLLTLYAHYQFRWAHLAFLVYLGNFLAPGDPTVYLIQSRTHPLMDISIGHFWSLCIEEQFYLIWPFFVLLIGARTRIIKAACALAMLTLIVRSDVVSYLIWGHRYLISPVWISHTLPFRVDTLFVGGILALLLRGPAADRWQRLCPWIFLTSATVLTAIILMPQPYRGLSTQSFGLTFSALGCASLIGWSLRTNSPSFRFFSSRILRYLGKYSYSFYIIHMLFMAAWSQARIDFAHALHSKNQGILAVMVLNFVITLMLAKLSYHFFELPFMRLKSRFEYDQEIVTHQHAFVIE
jgi:peptidoglycan/LPS O-acetylase OafA/YrhL